MFRLDPGRGSDPTGPVFRPNIPVIGLALVRLGIFQPMADGPKFLLKEDSPPGLCL